MESIIAVLIEELIRCSTEASWGLHFRMYQRIFREPSLYIADPENDNILFANRELIEFAGCRDFDDFLDYTDHRFRNLIHPDERDSVETSIWKQIYAKTSGNNDYVRFHFAKRWNISPVLDHGRIVENRYYGNVFYVLIMDCALVESYYDNKTCLETVPE